MSIGRKLSELEAMANQLGLQLDPAKLRRSKPGKQDYVTLIQNYFLDKYEQEGRATPLQRWVHENLESPKLATSETQVKPGVTEKMFADPDVGFQEKLDGCRCLICYEPDKGFGFYSRNRSVTDCCFGNYTDQIKGFERPNYANLFKKSFVLDSEIVCESSDVKARMQCETQLEAVVALLALNQADSWRVQEETGYPIRFKVFDILMFDGQSTMGLPYEKRDQLCSALLEKIAVKAEE